MLIDLVENIKIQFPENKIYLYGASWGTVLNCKVYKELQNCNLSNKEIDTLEESMQNTSKDAFNNTLSLANKYTNLYYYHGDEASNWDFYMSCFHVFLSPDYPIMDAIHAYSNPSGDSLFLQVMDIDMSEQQLQTKISYLLLQGEDDIITPVAYNQQLVEENPYMTLKVFENAGHIPTNASFEEMWKAIIEFTNKTEKVEVKY